MRITQERNVVVFAIILACALATAAWFASVTGLAELSRLKGTSGPIVESSNLGSRTGSTLNRLGANQSADPLAPSTWEPVVLTSAQVEIKTWMFQGATYAYLKFLFPNAGYRVVSFELPTRVGNDFTGDASVEKFNGSSVQALTTTAGIYDLGPITPGAYSFTFKNSGAAVKSLAFTVTAPPLPANSIDDARQFVKEQYRDFLNREADQAGEDFWTDNITKCSDPTRRPAAQTEAQCTLRQRETTSGAFFLSPEFQYTGYFVYRMFQGGLGRQPKLSEFTPDAQFVGAGIVVNGQLFGAKINQNKADYAEQFVNCTDAAKYRCSEFKAIYDSLSNQQYVDKLFQNTGAFASAGERAALVNGLNANPATETRASVLQKVVDGIVVISEGNQQFTTFYGQLFYDSEFTRAFVQLEYFGYMERDPDDAGYAFWLGKLNQFGGDFVAAEMVLAFISSPEYRSRFEQSTPKPSPSPTPTPPGVVALKLVPTFLSLAIDDDSKLLALNASGAVTWSSSNPAVATVDGVGQVKALSKGNAVISAASGTDVATSTLTVYRTTGANPDPSSEALIAQALAGGRISAEQALMYRVFALFGDPRLPAEFAGAPGSGSNHLLLRELGTTIASLSSSAQAVLRPFLLPPIYAESWYAQRLGLPERAPAADALQAIATPTPSYNCEVSRLQAYYTRVSTTHFNIFYYKLGDAAYDGQSAAAVQLIATLVEQAYAADSDLLKRFIKLDDKEPCNGGDGAYDIYYGSFASKELGAWTSTYPLAPELIGQNACRNRPSMMMINSQSAEFMAVNRNPQDAKLMVKSILAHELLHALQFAMDRPASCKDEEWIDEATAQWVMDHVVPTIPQGEPGEFGMESGLGRVSINLRKSGSVLAEYLYSGHMKSIEEESATPKLNGYSDYLFFQFLARKQTPDKIKQIFDAMVGGKNSIEAIAAVVDMKSVWPEFARSLWIGVDDKVLDYWATEDEYAFGLAKVYAEVPTIGIDPKLKDRLKSLKLDQKSQREAKFELLENALEFESGDYKIPPRSIFYEHLKFTDPTVHAVSFYNPISELENKEFMKVQAVTKINGKWDPPEDWTTNTYKLFCLDKKNERIEELLIIASNSEVNRSSEKPFTISASDPMLVETSNAGCWRWEGTASLTTNLVQGPVEVGSATVTFEPFRFQGQGTFPGFEAFKPTKLDASYTVNGPYLGTACTVSGSDHVLLQDDDPSGFILNFNQPDAPANRLIFGGGSSTIRDFISTRTCTGQPPETSKVDQSFSWLSFPDEVQLSEDGRTISGRWDRTDSRGTKTSKWNFTAQREP